MMGLVGGGGLPEVPRSTAGEIYQLGPHRLICGDATDPSAYEKLLAGEKASLLWTDPPYNVGYKSRGKELEATGKKSISNDDLDLGAFERLADASFYAISIHLRPGASCYVCSGWSSYPQFVKSLDKAGFENHGVIIWVKNSPVLGWRDYATKHEWIAKAKRPEGARKAGGIVYAWKKGETHDFYNRGEFDVWDMPRKATMQYLHPTEKPDWLPMRAIRNSTKRDEIILDPFAGSGSVMAAAEKTGRRAFMIELDPKFCDVIRDRWDRIEKAKKINQEKTA